LHAIQAQQQGVVQHVAADPQQPRHQPVLPAGQPQVLHAAVVAVAAHPCLEPWHQLEVPPHQLQAAAHGGLVHGQGCGGPLLRLGELEQIEDVQVGQGRWRLIAGRRGGHGRHHETAASLRESAAARGVAHAKDGSCAGRPLVGHQ